MAVDASTRTLYDTVFGHARVDTWGPIANTDTITPLALPINADRSVQFEGTFGAVGTFGLQGSNDGVHYHTLHDPQGNLISVTAAGIVQVSEIVWWVAPALLSGGDGTTAVTVSVLSRGTL